MLHMRFGIAYMVQQMLVTFKELDDTANLTYLNLMQELHWYNFNAKYTLIE